MSERRRTPIPGQDDAEDRLLAMAAALASELAVTRERLDTLERVLAAKQVIEVAEVESFAPTLTDTAERDTIRRRIIARVFRPIRDAATRARNDQEADR